MNELISDYLKMKDVEFLKDYRLSRLSTVRIGGIADVVAFPKNIGELCSALDFCLKNEIFCKNPRCITSCEQELDHIFTQVENGEYRCLYCEAKAK